MIMTPEERPVERTCTCGRALLMRHIPQVRGSYQYTACECGRQWRLGDPELGTGESPDRLISAEEDEQDKIYDMMKT